MGRCGCGGAESTTEQVSQTLGEQSISFTAPVYIQATASVVGKKEGEGPLGGLFDQVEEDDMLGQKSWEDAESMFQSKAADLILGKSGLQKDDIRMIFSGDLLAQSIASTFGIGSWSRPIFGLYGACSTMGESLALGSMAVAGGYGDWILAMTSSHFATAEKEFRFPLGYGNQRPLSASWTVTGSGACLLGKKKTKVKITGLTVGKIVDYGMKDSQNMGACMAPAAADTILQNFRDFSRRPEDYDKIFTGDLGSVGQQILLDLLEEEGYQLSGVHEDCGILIFDAKTQDTHAGGSGCGCSATVLASLIVPKIEAGDWKRVLFVPTGAMLSKVSFNEGGTVPGIAQAVVLERED